MNTILLPIAALLIAVLLIIIYFSKRNMVNEETKIYSRMLWVNLVYAILAVVTFIYAKTIADEIVIALLQKAYMISMIALTVLIYITRIYEREIKKEKIVETKNDVIDDLIKFIRSNFKRNLTLDYLAAYVHLSPAYLSRYFKKCTGVNITDFITKTRIDRAKQILKTSNYSIQEISEFCGYKDMSNFQRVFKRLVGVSASQYRQNNK